jgi:guanosine-3',5'-bis(diphosphate) 3'-pyrophosphohydrolase
MKSSSPGPLWQEAVAFAARAHRNQLRKDEKTPYVAHVVRVTMTVAVVFGCTDETALLAALLHDTIEDTGTDFDDLEERFGRKAAEVVAALTKNAALPEKEREEEYDRRLAQADWRAKLIKLADTYDNLCDSIALGQPPAKVRKVLTKCDRAIRLARADGHDALNRAALIVERAASSQRKHLR